MFHAKQLKVILPLALIVIGLLGYNFISAQWAAPTAVAPNNNTAAPINVSSSYQAKLGDLGAVRMRAGEYCNADGTVCWSDFEGDDTPTGTYGQWRNMTSQRVTNTWYKNNSQNPLAVSFVGGDNTEAFASVTGQNTNMVQVASHAADTGQRTPGFFIIPPQQYYKWVGSISYVSEMVLGIDDLDHTSVYNWVLGAWSCNASAPAVCQTTYGTNVRTVICKDQYGTTVADSNCPVPKPSTTGTSCSRQGQNSSSC